MIASLKGIVYDIFPKYIILVVNNIGYKIEGCNLDCKIGQELQIYTYVQYLETDRKIFGFINKHDYELFELLITVSGVGPRLAVNLINAIGTEIIINAINAGKVEDIKGKGIGNKTAQKIIIELSGKLGEKDNNFKIRGVEDELKINELKSALKGLGYSHIEINDALAKLKDIENNTVSDLIKKTLKLIR